MQAADYMDACGVAHPNVVMIYRVWDSEAAPRSIPSEASISEDAVSQEQTASSEGRAALLWVVMELCRGGALTAARMRRGDGSLNMVRASTHLSWWWRLGSAQVVGGAFQ